MNIRGLEDYPNFLYYKSATEWSVHDAPMEDCHLRDSASAKD